MNPRRTVTVLAAVLAICGMSYAAWRYAAERSHRNCRACERPVHEHSRTVGLLDGKRAHYCCPACAISESRQLGKTVKVVELTDHASGKALDPAGAWIVRDSDMNHCLRHTPAISPDKQPMQTLYDRCSPSLLAFASRREADAFARSHGGRVLAFPAMEAELAKAP